MAWASWTTPGVFSGRGGVDTDESGVVQGDLTVHTTWDGTEVDVTVQYTGTSDWFTLVGSPVRCPTEEHSRALHQAVVAAVRAGGGATLTGVAVGELGPTAPPARTLWPTRSARI
ncbi:hypothetical protein AB0O01_02650 [Streptomyces sp. NPDC093252]|uniref:hypothetical protein n=1 Tax=Streptomyces sp. NPDC093252 TaxID=3154980 RepID=UPI003419DB9E